MTRLSAWARRHKVATGVIAVLVVLVVAGAASGATSRRPASVSSQAVSAPRPPLTEASTSTTVAAPTSTTVAPPAPTTANSAPDTHPSSEDGWPLPDAARTPGEVFAAATTEAVCTGGWAEAHRDVTEAERHAVFASYRIPYANHRLYELDHLIPLELGGDNSARNLWPELGPDPNPKDSLENRLHDLVCAGSLGLGSAQHAIATDWVAAYHLFVGPGGGGAPPAPASAPDPAPAPSAAPVPAPAPAPSGAGDQGVVHPGAFCAPVSATGHTDRGTAMVCGPASDGHDRWHSR